MKDLYAVLREKEQQLARVRKEVGALLAVIPLLVDTGSVHDESRPDTANAVQSLAASANGAPHSVIYDPFVDTLIRNKLEPPRTVVELK